MIRDGERKMNAVEGEGVQGGLRLAGCSGYGMSVAWWAGGFGDERHKVAGNGLGNVRWLACCLTYYGRG